MTERFTFVACTIAPDVPVTVITELAIGVAEVVVTVMVEVPVVSEVGLKLQVAPAGVPLQVKATVPVNPLVGETVIVDVPVCPGPTMVVGVPPTEKSAAETKPGHEVARTLALIEPRPVTKSYPALAL